MSNRLFTVYWSLSVLTMAAAPLRAAEPVSNASPVVTVSISATAPTLDGAIGVDEWVGPVVQGFYQPNADLLDRRGGRFLLASDGKALYVAVETPVHPRYGPVLRRASPDPDDMVFDDSIEVWVAPGLTGPAEAAYQIMVDAGGGCALRRFVDASPNINFFGGGWELAGYPLPRGTICDSRWTVELAIPLSVLGPNAPGAGLRLRVCRNYKLPFVQSRDGVGVVYYKDAATMTQVRFLERAPLVGEPDWVGLKGERAMVTLRNPTQAALKVAVGGQAIELAPGAVQETPVPVRTGDRNSRRAEVLITAPDGTVLHRRTPGWLVTDTPIWEEVL